MTSQNYDDWFDTYFDEARTHQVEAEYGLSDEDLDELYEPMSDATLALVDRVQHPY